MKIHCILLTFFILLSNFVLGQIDENLPINKNRFFVGGNFSAQFGDITLLDISPLLGYNVTEKLSTGIGATYLYYSFRDKYNTNSNFSTSIYGGRIFSKYIIYRNIFSYIEYELLCLETNAFDPYRYKHKTDRFFLNSFFVGGGLRQFVGNNACMNLLVLWNINDSMDSFYNNPVIRVGIIWAI